LMLFNPSRDIICHSGIGKAIIAQQDINIVEFHYQMFKRA